MNVSLPDELKSYVDERVAEGSYGTSSEYVRDLIRKDKANQHVRKLILDGMESPLVATADAEYWAEKRKRHSRKP